MSFLNSLNAWQPWLLLGLIPPAIVLLYFLKLKRMPLQVPSTFLWSRTIEDLHVNTIWQRLRQSLLLFLQLLLLALILLSLWRPGLQGLKLTDNRFIFLIDTSASMSSKDVGAGRTRLEEAKRQVAGMIDQMRSGDVAMLMSVSDIAKIEAPYTDNRNRLKDELAEIQPTNRRSNLIEALRYASGLANPERTGTEDTDVQVAKAQPATLYIMSDGGFEAVPEFNIGNLNPIYVPIGESEARNVAITAFKTETNPEQPDKSQAFARLENSGPEDVEVELSLYNESEQLLDAVRTSVPSRGTSGVEFELANLEGGLLKLVLEYEDDLALDNVAYAVVNAARPAQVLIVRPTGGFNDPIGLALTTEVAQEIAVIQLAKPDDLTSPALQQAAEAGLYDLIIYDRCAPETMPQANTLFIGSAPPLEDWKVGQRQSPPLLIDYDRSHPLMGYVELGDVNVIEGSPVEPPKGGRKLIEADIGCLFALAARGGFEDAVLGFPIVEVVDGDNVINTNWIIRRSFPVFAMNILRYLGGVRGGSAASNVQPGEPAVIRTLASVDAVTVTTPSQQQVEVLREGQNAFVMSRTEELGVYKVAAGDDRTQKFAVNLFDSRESDIKLAETLEIGHDEFKGQSGYSQTRRELWKWVLLLALGVLMFEWYIYNKRVYL